MFKEFGKKSTRNFGRWVALCVAQVHEIYESADSHEYHEKNRFRDFSESKLFVSFRVRALRARPQQKFIGRLFIKNTSPCKTER
jgi:hypothetical protein